jgi:hypothetical protein
MRRNGLKLNPEKCIFGIRRGQLLGCMVSKWGIQANPQKIEALRRMQPPSSRMELQRLTGRIASLNRSFPRLLNEAYPSSRCFVRTQLSSGARSNSKPSTTSRNI